MRAVVVDLESVVRTIAVEPYTDKRIYQVGAVRAGADTAWVVAAPAFTRWVELPDEQWVIASDRVRAAHAAEAVPPAEALAALLSYAADADVVVAYNGGEADFPLLAEACDREEIPHLPGEYVDGYYLALAVWPTAPSHRLAHLAEHVGIQTADLTWHDAAADAVLLTRLLGAAAAELAGWPRPLRDLIASTVPDSPAWRLIRELAGSGTVVGEVRPHTLAEITAATEAELAGHRRRRALGAAVGRGPLAVGDAQRTAGRVDPVLLAQVAHGGAATRRPAQEEMTTALHRWADDGIAGLIEAPTGTGKSLAVLAAALDWLAGDPRRTAIVTTFTKQLQSQLADDVAALDAVVPGLLDASNVVKGASNRLSLRALVAALADATALDTGRSARPGSRNRFLRQLGFRELTVYLLLQLRAATDRVAGWAAHSVDPVDVPAFFSGYVGPVLPLWLDSLSQGANGEFDAAAARPLAAHTDLVSEALAGHRLILANHALLLAHADDLAGLGEDTLLIADEAHQLEDAATAAMTTTLDYRAVEDLYGELESWVADHQAADVARTVRNLGSLLDHEQLPKVAGLAFDARSAGPGVLVGSRSVTLASPYAGTSGVPQVRSLAGLITRLGGQCRAIVGALSAFLTANPSTLDFFAIERLRGLIARTAAVDDASATIVGDIDAILGPPPWAAQAATPAATDDGTVAVSAEGDHAVTPADDETDDGDSQDEATDRGETDTDDSDAGTGDAHDGGTDDASASAPPLPPDLTNQVVYAEEIEALRGGLRSYRFRLASAPIELPADARWQQFLVTFTRTYYVSATLRVAGEWTFLRNRLGLPGTIAALALDTPFDLASQAELVCFSDFPSWAEQSDGAMRTLAHQLAGYTAEVVRSAPARDDPQPGDRGGFDGGAMVLTTARSTSGGIADYLAAELRRRGDDTPVHSALVTGNRRAVTSFTDTETGGGLLVGTKGLWQGVRCRRSRPAATRVDQQAAVRAVRRAHRGSAPRRRSAARRAGRRRGPGIRRNRDLLSPARRAAAPPGGRPADQVGTAPGRRGDL